jgi:hypothetical protein
MTYFKFVTPQGGGGNQLIMSNTYNKQIFGTSAVLRVDTFPLRKPLNFGTGY